MFQQKKIIVLRILLVLIISLLVFALPRVPQVAASPSMLANRQVKADGSGVTLYFFWGDGCPHCHRQWEFFTDTLLPQFPGLVIMDYETWNDRANNDLFRQMAAAYGFTPQGVPTTFIGDFYYVGFTDTIATQLTEAVKFYIERGLYPDPMVKMELALRPTATPTPRPDAEEAETAVTPPAFLSPSTQITIPLIGTIELANYSLLASTILIAIVDGFNPCSLWVLTMLIAISLHTGSRKRVFIIGFVFLTVTAAVYAIFIAGLFSLMSIVNYIGWIQAVVSLVAAAFALINIKDYFWYKEGVSMTIADEKKPGIMKKMRDVVNNSESWWGTITATVVLAIGVSLVEFSCTAGLPMVWTNLLNAQGVTVATFIVLLLVYMVIYQLDELIIFVPAVLTLKSSKFQEKQGRILKLIGGVVMLTIAVVLAVNPAWMHQLGNTLLMFLVAAVVTGLILLLHRVVLPRFGILIGTELNSKAKGKGKKSVKKRK